MILKSKFRKDEAIKIIKEEINTFPSFPNSILSFVRGTSSVMGKTDSNSFVLRNRMNTLFSVKAVGKIKETESGSLVEIEFRYPLQIFSMLLFYKEEIDEEVIVNFLKSKLDATEAA